jgi:hypothetical protein
MSYSKIISSQSVINVQKKRKQKKPTKRKNRAVCFFLRDEYLNTYVQRDTEEKKETRQLSA